MSKIKGYFTTYSMVRLFVWLILILVVISTAVAIVSPLFPDPEEYAYDGDDVSFPEKFWEILPKVPGIVIRHFVLFDESYRVYYILSLLGNVFLLLLVVNIRSAIGKGKKMPKPAEFRRQALSWALSSLVITIVFITRDATVENVAQVV